MIPAQDCADIIQRYDDHPDWAPHTWYRNRPPAEQVRELDVLSGIELDAIKKAISAVLVDYYDAVCEGEYLIRRYTDIRLNRYPTGTMMSRHFDHIKMYGQHTGIPVLTILGTLNRDYQGGNLVFFDDHELTTGTGDVIIFPSCWLYPHQVKPVTQGTRWSFVAWGD